MAVLSRNAGSVTRNRISPVEIRDTAAEMIAKYNFNISPCMVTAIATIESGDKDQPELGVNRLASRYEPHIGDVSTGVMQTLVTTARWLASDMGYTAKGIPAADDLYDFETSVYFGAAYLDWLSTYAGSERSEDWIVQSYNAGPGNKQGFYLGKYKTAKNNLKDLGVC